MHVLEIHAPADDHLHDAILGHVARLEGTGDPPIAEHRRAVRDLQHLIDIMRDENYAGTVAHDIADEHEQLLDIACRQKRCGLIELQQSRAVRMWPRTLQLIEGTYDCEQCTLHRRETRNGVSRIDRQTILLE